VNVPPEDKCAFQFDCARSLCVKWGRSSLCVKWGRSGQAAIAIGTQETATGTLPTMNKNGMVGSGLGQFPES